MTYSLHNNSLMHSQTVGRRPCVLHVFSGISAGNIVHGKKITGPGKGHGILFPSEAMNHVKYMKK